jgi:hypothetical protein
VADQQNANSGKKGLAVFVVSLLANLSKMLKEKAKEEDETLKKPQ